MHAFPSEARGCPKLSALVGAMAAMLLPQADVSCRKRGVLA